MRSIVDDVGGQLITQQAHDVRTMLYGRCYNVGTLKRRHYNVVLTLCACWANSSKVWTNLHTYLIFQKKKHLCSMLNWLLTILLPFFRLLWNHKFLKMLYKNLKYPKCPKLNFWSLNPPTPVMNTKKTFHILYFM